MNYYGNDYHFYEQFENYNNDASDQYGNDYHDNNDWHGAPSFLRN